MKKKIILLAASVLLPSAVFAADQPDQCALNSTCSFNIQGKFNKMFVTQQIQAGKTYKCSVIRGSGGLLEIKNVYASNGITYDLKGRRFNRPFVIHGPVKGVGYIKYTIYNHNDPWRSNSIQFKCQEQQ